MGNNRPEKDTVSLDIPQSGTIGSIHFAVVVHVCPLTQRDRRLRGVIVYIPYIVFSSVTIFTSLPVTCGARALPRGRHGLAGERIGRWEAIGWRVMQHRFLLKDTSE